MKMNNKFKTIAVTLVSSTSLAHGGITPIDACDKNLCPQPDASDKSEFNDLCPYFLFGPCGEPNWVFHAGSVIDFPVEVVNPAVSAFVKATAQIGRCTEDEDEGGSAGSSTLKSSIDRLTGSSWDVTANMTGGAKGWMGLCEVSASISIGGRYGQNTAVSVHVGTDHKIAAGPCKRAYAWGGAHYLLDGKAVTPVKAACTFKATNLCGNCISVGFMVLKEDHDKVDIDFKNMGDDGSANDAKIRYVIKEALENCDSCDCPNDSEPEDPTAPGWYTSGKW